METSSLDFRSTVDTSRPFNSVKEAVAVFGERLLLGETFACSRNFSPSPKPFTNIAPKLEITTFKVSPSPADKQLKENRHENAVFETLKKLEAELAETKLELKLLKERESETEVAIATLNAELHKNMSKLAEAEAEAAKAKADVVATKVVGEKGIQGEEEKTRGLMMRMEDSRTLAEILNMGEKESYFGGKGERKMMKKKPIVPLVGDLFSRKKGSNTNNHSSSLYSSPYFYN